jgi:hypothetical protein
MLKNFIQAHSHEFEAIRKLELKFHADFIIQLELKKLGILSFENNLTSETRFNFWLDYSAIWRGRKDNRARSSQWEHFIQKGGQNFFWSNLYFLGSK